MSFKLDDFTEYIKQNPEIDITDIVLNLSTIEAGYNFQQGIKHKEKLTSMEDDGTMIQVGDYTATDATGGILIEDKEIAVVERHVKENYNPQVLQSKVTSIVMKAGSDIQDIPAYIKDEILKIKSAAIMKSDEQSIWIGDKAFTLPFPTPANPAEIKANALVRHILDFDGAITLAQASVDTIKTAAAGVALTEATAEAKVKLVTSLIAPELVMDPTILAMSPSNFTIFRGAMIKKYVGNQSFSDQIGADWTYKIPGTEITARATSGLATKNDMMLSRAVDLTVGVDLLSEEEKGEMKMLENRAFEFFALYKLGAQLGNEKYIVVTKKA